MSAISASKVHAVVVDGDILQESENLTITFELISSHNSSYTWNLFFDSFPSSLLKKSAAKTGRHQGDQVYIQSLSSWLPGLKAGC